MTTTIKLHSKSPVHYNILNATPAMLTEASELTAGKWASISGTTIVVHKNFVSKFQAMQASEAKAAVVLTEADVETNGNAEDWIFENINSGKLANWFAQGSAARTLAPHVGKTAREIEAKFIGMVS